MSLPALQWRKLPIVTTAVTSSVSEFLTIINNMLTGSTYFDNSSRTVGSGSAWSSSIAYITGSNVEAIICYPPLTSSMSQSLLIVGKSSTGAASGGTLTMTTYEASYSTGRICFGISKNSGTFTNWTGSTPMGVSSSFSGYALPIIGALNGFSSLKITIYESTEAFLLCIGTPSALPTTNYVFMCGAVIDPQQVVTSIEAEVDNRIYGFFKASYSGLETIFLNSATAFLDNTGQNAQARAYYFIPQQSSMQGLTCMKPISTNLSLLTSITNKLVKIPIHFTRDTNPYSYVGTIRDCYIIRNSSNNLIFRDASSNIIGFTVSKADNATDTTLLLSYT